MFPEADAAAGPLGRVRRRNSGGFRLTFALRQLAEQGVGLLLFLKRLVALRHLLSPAASPNPSACHSDIFVVLGGLTAGEQACVFLHFHGPPRVCPRSLRRPSVGGASQHLMDLLKSSHMLLGFVAMGQKDRLHLSDFAAVASFGGVSRICR
jgi:hypothetical protein